MSQKNVKLYFEALSKDKELQEKLKKLNQKYEGQALTPKQLDNALEKELIPMAKELGYEFTLSEYKSFGQDLKKPQTGMLNDDELAAVSGGAGGCGCVLAGGGGEEGNTDAGCACVLGGLGMDLDVMSDNPPCLCSFAGAGYFE